MSIVSSRRRVVKFAAWALALVLFSLGVVAWSPIIRPASRTPPKIMAPKESHPLKWAAATGFLAATLAFAPMNTNAAAANELPLAAGGDNTAVKVQVETNSLIRSIEDNRGQLNKAVSDLVKDIPSKSIELDPPEEKAQAVRAVIKEDETAVEEQKVTRAQEKVTIVEEKVMEEPQIVEQVDKTPTETVTDAATAAATIVEKKAATPEEKQGVEKTMEKAKTEEAKLEMTKEESPKEEPKVETMKEAPKEEKTREAAKVEMTKETPKEEPKVETMKETPKVEPKVEKTKEASKVEMTNEAPKEEPKVEKGKEAQKMEMTNEAPKEEPKVEKTKAVPKEDPKVEKTKEAPKVEMMKEAPKEGPKVEKTKEAPKEEPKVKTKESPKVEMTKEAPKEEPKVEKTKEAQKVEKAPKVEVAEPSKPEPVILEAAKSVLTQITDQLQESGANQFMDDLPENLQGSMDSIARFWNTPSGFDIKIPPSGSHPDGQTFKLSRLNVAGGSLLALGASYYVSYEYYNYENEQEEIKAKKKKADIKAKLAAKKKGEKAAKAKKEVVKGAAKPKKASGASSLDSRCETTSQELLATAMAAADAAAAAAEPEAVTAKAPAVSPNGATAPSVTPNGATVPPVSPNGATAPPASPARDSTMDAFSRALAAMSNPAGQNGQTDPATSAEEARTPEKDSPPVVGSASSYLDSLSRR